MAARKTSTKPTRIWEIACAPERVVSTTSSAVSVREIAWRSNRYYNALVRIERDRWDRFAATRRRYAPELAALEDEWTRLDERAQEVLRGVKRERQAHWREHGEKRRILSKDAKAKLDALDADKRLVSDAAKGLRKEFKALLSVAQDEFKRRSTERANGGASHIKAAANAAVLAEMLDEAEWPDAWKETARTDDAAHAAMLAARAACRLPSGTYSQVEAAFTVARQKSAKGGHPPRFSRLRDEAKFAVQLPLGTTYGDIIAGKCRRVSIVDTHTDGKPTVTSRRVVKVSLDQSIPRGEKCRVVMTTRLQREPPLDAEVKWVWIIMRPAGNQTVFALQFTLESDTFAVSASPRGTRPPEHVRIGWAHVDGGVRIAHWPSGDVVVPDATLGIYEHARSIESVADFQFVLTKRRLRLWMRGGPHRLTAWHFMISDRSRSHLRSYCEAYASWALGGRGNLLRLWREWVRDRKSRGEDLYSSSWRVHREWLRARGIHGQEEHVAFAAYTWARKDAHLLEVYKNLRRKFENVRNDFFRREARRIASEYESITVDNYAIATLRELPSLTMSGDAPREQSQHNAHAVAPGRFREVLRSVMGDRCTPCERSRGEADAGTARKQIRRQKGGSKKNHDAAATD